MLRACIDENGFWPEISQAIQSAILGFSLILVLQQIVAGKAAIQETARCNEAWNRFISGQWTPDMEHYVYPDAQPRYRLSAICESITFTDNNASKLGADDVIE
jgi:hypothetical protein